jgi:hypothetical protein
MSEATSNILLFIYSRRFGGGRPLVLSRRKAGESVRGCRRPNIKSNNVTIWRMLESLFFLLRCAAYMVCHFGQFYIVARRPMLL